MRHTFALRAGWFRPLHQNVADLHFREGLAVPDGLLILLLALELENQHLVTPAVAQDGGLHGAARHQLAPVLEGGLRRQLDLRAHLAGQFFHADDVARSDAVLFSAGLNDRVHANLYVWEPEHTECVGTTGVNHQSTTPGPGLSCRSVFLLYPLRVRDILHIQPESADEDFMRPLLAALAWIGAGAAASAQTPTLRIRVLDYARLPDATLRDFQAAARGPRRLGSTVREGKRGLFSYIFWMRVEQAARDHGVEPSLVLAHVIAHEAGHLLGLDHGAAGVMSPELDRPELLRAASQGNLGFTEHESAALRRALNLSAAAMNADKRR